MKPKKSKYLTPRNIAIIGGVSALALGLYASQAGDRPATYNYLITDNGRTSLRRDGSVAFSGENVINQSIVACPAGGAVKVDAGTTCELNFGTPFEGDPIGNGVTINTPNITLYGDGLSSVLKLMVGNCRAVALGYRGTGVAVRDLLIDGNNTNPHPSTPGMTADALVASFASGVRFANLGIINGGGADGIGCFMQTRNIFDHLSITGCEHGIAMSGGSSLCRVESCDILQNKGDAILTNWNAYDNIFHDNICMDNGYFGCEIDGSQESGSWLYPQRIQILNNQFIHNNWGGISLYSASFCQINDNLVANNVGAGVRIWGNGISGASANQITANEIYNDQGFTDQTWGVELTAESFYAQVVNNTFYNNTLGAIHDLGNSSVTSPNNEIPSFIQRRGLHPLTRELLKR